MITRAHFRRLAAALLPAVLVAGCGSSSQPAATVDGHDISVAAYHQQIFYKRQVAVDSGGVDQCQRGNPRALCQQLKSSALTDLIDDAVVQEYADKHHISVSDADFNRAWAQIYKQRFLSNPAMVKAFGQRMHLTQTELKDRVRQDLLRSKVQAAVITQSFQRAPAIRPAAIYASSAKESSAIRTSLRAGTPFLAEARALAAQKKSACALSGGCGDVGWVPEAILQPYQRFLLNKRVGTPLGPFRLQQGYVFYFIEGRSSSHPLNANQQAELRALAFSRWLAQQERHSTIKRYATT